jgi:sugar/nucleoside kinase (ribokinase family)
MELLRKDPFISQQEIAHRLNVNRSTVATIISKMVEKGYLLGRAYIINDKSQVVCIGGMNLDRKYQLSGDMIPGTSNPVNSSQSLGGVARNIAENLGRLDQMVTLLSVAGYDQDYDWIKLQTEKFVNLRHVTQLDGQTTSSYTAILDRKGSMQLGLADMGICDRMTPTWLTTFKDLITQSRLVVADLNLPLDTINELIRLTQKYAFDLVIIPVSGPKMDRLPENLIGVKWLIVNQDESEMYFDCRIRSEEDLVEVSKLWLDRGVKHVLITRGAKASYYASQDGTARWIDIPKVDSIVDVTGAGDSFSAGLIYGLVTNKSPLESIGYGLCNANKTIQTKESVRTDLSVSQLELEYQVLKSKGEL